MQRFLVALFCALVALPAAAQEKGPGESAFGSILRANTRGQVVHGGAVTPSNCAIFDVATCTVSSNITVTVDCGRGPMQNLTNNSAFTLAAPVNDGSCEVIDTNGASAGTVTLSGFSTNSAYVGAALTTTNGNKFSIFVWRNNGTSGYFIYPHQ